MDVIATPQSGAGEPHSGDEAIAVSAKQREIVSPPFDRLRAARNDEMSESGHELRLRH
jgi:hypothetical protein